MAFGMLLVSSLALLRSLGVGEALIFRREVDQKSCDTAFVLSVALAVALYIAVFFAAPSLAGWLTGADPLAVAELLRALAILVVLQGLGNVSSALLERELAFDKKIYVDALPTLAYALVAVGLAWGGFGVWSMVWGRLLASCLGLVAAWSLSPWRPGWQFDWLRLRQLGAYGRYVSAAAIVSFFVVSIDDLLVGRLGGQLELGYYARAYLIANLPVTAVAHVASRVAFPAYARLAGEGGGCRRDVPADPRGGSFVDAAYGALFRAVGKTLYRSRIRTCLGAYCTPYTVSGWVWFSALAALECGTII